MKSPTRHALWFLVTGTAILGMVGCSSWQLNENTLDVGSSVGELYKNQVLTNLAELERDPNTIPSLFLVSTGSITTHGEVGVKFGIPLGNTVTQVVSDGASEIIAPYSSLALPFSNHWTQNWSIAPMMKATQLEVLRTGYLMALQRWSPQVVALDDIGWRRNEPPSECGVRPDTRAAGTASASTAEAADRAEKCQLRGLLDKLARRFDLPEKQFRAVARGSCASTAQPLVCLGPSYGSMAQRLSRSQELAVNDPAAVHDLILFTLRVEETVSPSVGSR